MFRKLFFDHEPDVFEMIEACPDYLALLQKKKPRTTFNAKLKDDPIFNELFFYYLIVNTMVTRLFAIWDRSVYVTTPLLARFAVNYYFLKLFQKWKLDLGRNIGRS